MRDILRFSRILFAAAFLFAVRPVLAGGGNVLPAGAHPHGFSLADMAKAIAPFTLSGNNSAEYPDTPFQILYVTDFKTNTGSFAVDTGTMFFVPLAWGDDSFPVLGDFPRNQGQAGNYWFGDSEVGMDVAEIEVDGEVTQLNSAYAALASTPGLADGANNSAQLGAFLTPLTKGTHTVTIRFQADGDAIPPYNDLVLELFGFEFAPGGVWQFGATYTVTVR